MSLKIAPTFFRSLRIIRDANLLLEERKAEDLLHEMERKLPRRQRGSPVRLDMEKDVHPYAYNRLRKQMDIIDNAALIDGPLDLSYWMKFAITAADGERLRYPEYKPIYPQAFKQRSFFSVLSEQDVALFHPYESFDAFNDFIEQAAIDPAVTAVKMTLYRVSKHSRITRALIRAAQNGKHVTVVVELKARFDEERNIAWAKALEKAGCEVIYGWIGLKIHAKMTLVERQETGGPKRYVHMSTGNYNGQTAKLYTDIGLFTAEAGIAAEVSALFDEISGFVPHRKSNYLAVSPTDLRAKLYSLIDNEISSAAAGKPAKIIAKMNSLSDRDIIDKLYEASNAGVKIDLIVRGICCLCPGVSGQSANIAVRSIVDRFLEHSRIFYFESGGNPRVWLSSADWMTRNLTHRIEIMFPILDPGIRRTVIRLLHLQLKDNLKAHELQAHGEYRKAEPAVPYIRSQYKFLPILYRTKNAAFHYSFKTWSGTITVPKRIKASDYR